MIALASMSGPAFSQTGTQSTSSTKPASAAKILAIPVRIAPGDLVEITVFDSQELTQQVRVGDDGNVQLSLIGSTNFNGLTAQEAARLVAGKLKDQNFLINPQVSVLIKEFASQGVSVTGEVQHPGVYQVLGPRTLLDVISLAGGLTSVADTRVTVKRRSGEQENITVKLKNDDAQSSLANDLQVYPGDLVLVPRAGLVYVLGDVNKPGGFVMQDSGKITLLQALAQAGGVSHAAAPNAAVLMRKNGEGYVSNQIHVGRIERGKDQDIELHANDIVFVPNSRLKNAIQQTQSVAQSIGSASIYAVIH
jgi:polysaccharide export outer membrane protein